MSEGHRENLLFISGILFYCLNAYWFKWFGYENDYLFKASKDLVVLFSIFFVILKFIRDPILIPRFYIAFFVFIFIQIFIGLLRFESLINIFVGIRNYIFPILFSFLVSYLTIQQHELLIRFLFKSILILSIFGILLFFSPLESYIVRLGGDERAVSLIGNPSSLAIVNVWAILYFYFTATGVKKWLSLFVLSYSLILTSSSTGFLLLVIAMFFYNSRRVLSANFLIFSPVFVLILLSIFPRLYTGFVEFNDPSLLARFSIIANVFGSMNFYEYIFGVGIGTAANLFISDINIVAETDNSYLAVFYQFGLLGLAFFIIFLSRMYIIITEKWLKGIFLTTCVAALAGNVFELGFPINYIFFILVMMEYLKHKKRSE